MTGNKNIQLCVPTEYLPADKPLGELVVTHNSIPSLKFKLAVIGLALANDLHVWLVSRYDLEVTKQWEDVEHFHYEFLRFFLKCLMQQLQVFQRFCPRRKIG